VRVSVVIPVYGGVKTIESLVEGLSQALAGDHELEVVLVDDASPDGSGDVCRSLAQRHDWVRVVRLARNFGEHSAVMAGLHHATGECVVTMDDDLQNPPTEVSRLLAALGDGVDVVYGDYVRKRHGPIRNLGSWFNGWVAVRALGKPPGLYLSSFRAMSRFVVDELKRVEDPFPYVDGYILRVTRDVVSVPVEHHARAEGRSGYTMRKLIGLWLNQVTNFSLGPLRLASYMGLLISLLGVVGAVIFAVERAQNPDLPEGWASLIVAVTILGGVQLFALGMIGEYLGRLFQREGGTPQFVVRETIDCSPEGDR
jgi:undecaprenyl-phosphate 4-deoxy-4-formamido-L-arabinose transferase